MKFLILPIVFIAYLLLPLVQQEKINGDMDTHLPVIKVLVLLQLTLTGHRHPLPEPNSPDIAHQFYPSHEHNR